MSLPDSASFGNPPERGALVPETFIGAAGTPLAANGRKWSWTPWPVRSIQLTTASPDARLNTSTRPAGLPPSTRIFLPNVLSESVDHNRINSRLSSGAVDQ